MCRWQVVHHARIEEEQGSFNFEDVCDGICRKLIVRHPHVFADVQVSSTGEVLDNWEKIKQQTKGQTTGTETLTSVPKTFPALMRAQKVQKRANKLGFSYPDVYWAMDDLNSELDELQEAVEEEDPQSCFRGAGGRAVFCGERRALSAGGCGGEPERLHPEVYCPRAENRAACRPARTGLKGSVDPGAGRSVEAGQGRMLKQPSSLQADEKRKDHLNGG